MTNKRPNWNKCSGPFIGSRIQQWPNLEPFTPGISVEVGMTVAAEYGKNLVCLKITKILGDNEFEAKIECFEPINVTPPRDLKEDEIVIIDREHICSFFQKNQIS